MSTQVSPLLYSPRNDIPDALVQRPNSTPEPEHRAFRPWESEHEPNIGYPSANMPFLIPHHIEQTEANPTPPVSVLSAKLASETISEHKAIPSSTTNKYITVSWIFEILAVTVSVLSIIAIIAVLYHENGRPLAAWTFVLTLNTVIATLGTLARTMLAFAISACIGQQKWTWLHRKPDRLVAFERFDEASRGPWGGFCLLVWLRARHWAALGALVAVGAIAFDPFLQAVITTYGSSDGATTEQNATIGYALKVDSGQIINWYESGPNRLVNTSVGVLTPEDSFAKPDFGIVSSIYSGFYNESMQQSLAADFQCATGNCTWSPYVSAAVCSRCEDVSNRLKLSHGYGRAGSTVPNQSNMWYNENYTQFSLPSCDMKNWDISLPSNSTDWWQYTTYGGTSPARTLMTANTTYDPRATLMFKDVQTLLMAFTVMRAGGDWLEAKVPWNESTPIATECALYLCANAYQTQIQKNVLQDNVTGSWAIRDQSSYKSSSNYTSWTQENITAWDDLQGAKLFEPFLHFPKHDLRLLVPEDSANYLNLTTQEVNITYKFIRTLTESLITFRGENPSSDVSNFSVMAFPNVNAPGMMDALWSSTNLTTTFDNVAKSITNRIRSSSTDRHLGTTQTWVIRVRVRWAYLAYPIGMLLIGIVYVGCTIVESKRLGMPVWKESALPTLLHGFDDSTQERLRGQEENRKVRVNNVHVRFAYDGDKKCMRLIPE